MIFNVVPVNAEEEKHIETLLAKELSSTQQKAALFWMRNYLEEGDILNLPASKRTLDALSRCLRSSTIEAALKSRASKLLKQYKR